MRFSRYTHILLIIAVVLFATQAQAQEVKRQFIKGSVPPVVQHLQSSKALDGTNRLNLAIGLPLRNQVALTNSIKQLYDPATPNFHAWLTPEQFTEQFGPTKADYQKVIDFAKAHGLKITHTHSNRMLLDVTGATTNIENAFQVKLRVYQHPTEQRTFYAPDTEPSVETNVPVLCVSGLNNFTLPHRLGGGIKPISLSTNQGITAYATGSSPGGYFMGNDFRKAYVPGVTNTGAGQYIAIVDVGGPYYMNDVYMYETNAGLSTNIVITNILLSGSTGIPVGNTANEGEQVLDIDMAISMAPDAMILNYEGEAHDVFNQIAIDNKAKQMTLSYGFGIDASILQMFQQFAAQGQSFSQASGDGGADLDGGLGLTGNPYATIVGGTSLTTTAGGSWQSDVTWSGSGGGISGYGIPNWQQGIATSANQGSTSYRNYPDVAMPAVNIFTVYMNGTAIGATGGTSAASPLWAGFIALVNQQAATLGKPSAGFVNPAIYAIGMGASGTYLNCFHDITSGNTVNSQNPAKYYARSGYDLCTGWGTPTGSNTINALAGIGTNDFIFYASSTSLNLVPGGTATSIIQTVPLNGLSSGFSFSIAGLPAGVTAQFTSASITNTTMLTLTTVNPIVPGIFPITLTATSGSLSHTIALNLAVTSPIPGATQVGLSSFYNRAGIYADRRTFSGGLDGGGYAYSANLLGSTLSWNGVVFNLGPANALDVIRSTGQTITLTAGNFSTLLMLATGVQGNQLSQTFTVTYADNTIATFSQNLSDWASAQQYVRESVAVKMAYRNNGGGTLDTGTAVNLYGYSFTLDQTKTVKSITLPNNGNVLVLAIALANTPASAALDSYYNRAGIYSDGTTFTNPATGGIDGIGTAYSATLLGYACTWAGVQFNFGPPNITNVISAAGQTLTLPKGNYSVLRMLATGVEGRQAGQVFTVTYADATTTNYTQSLSDWFTPQNSLGESNVVTMGHRNSSNGTQDNRTFYLYGYTFKLNSSKVVQSIRLPNNGNVIVTAISLTPDWAPYFVNDPFTESSIVAGQIYSANVATNATDLNGDSLTFSKVSGPAWLNVASNGTLSGTPLSGDMGNNGFVLQATNPGGLSDDAILNISVAAPPSIMSSISIQTDSLLLNWTGGIAPYQVQTTTDLANPDWENIGGAINGNSLVIRPTNAATFYRILGQ